MGLQQRRHAARKGCNAIFSAFPRANGELLHLEVDILDPKADSLHAAQAAAVQKLYNQLGSADQKRDERGHLFARHHNGDMGFLVCAHGVDRSFHGLTQHALVEENKRVHGLVLRGCGHVALHGQMGQEGFDLGFAR